MPCYVQYRFSETFTNLKSLERAAKALNLYFKQTSATSIQIGGAEGTLANGVWTLNSTDRNELDRIKDEYLTAEISKKAELSGWKVRPTRNKKTNKITLKLFQ